MTELSLTQAAEALLAGHLVVIPTETVYGLAGIATNPDTVRQIYEVKGRPAGHPLIVHGPDFESLEPFAIFNSTARRAAKLWPGPITLILEKTERVPLETTGGKPTVGIRVPNHPIALALLRRVGQPLAAPSANRFTRLSATRVEDLDPEIARQVAGVVNGGPCRVGLESTVLDLTDEAHPTILREGFFTKRLLSEHLGKPVGQGGQSSRSPGTHRAHYQPQTPVEIVKVLLPTDHGLSFRKGGQNIVMPAEPAAYAARLYAALAEADRMGWDTIRVEAPPDSSEWEAVWDRLRRAAADR